MSPFYTTSSLQELCTTEVVLMYLCTNTVVRLYILLDLPYTYYVYVCEPYQEKNVLACIILYV